MKMRILHRYLGFFLAGIMCMYAISGIVLIFRNTDLLKRETKVELTLEPNLATDELCKELGLRKFAVEEEKEGVVFFRNGFYTKATGAAEYTVKELPYVLDKMTHLHKANTKQPLFWLNIIFGFCLLFFVISSFWMFVPSTSTFRKGLIFSLAGLVLALVLIFL